MNKKVLFLILGAIGLLTLYEIFSNSYSVILLLVALGSFWLKNKVSDKNKRILLLISLFSFTYLLFSNRFFLLFLMIILLVSLSYSSAASNIFSTIFSSSTNTQRENKFVMIDFEEMDKSAMIIRKNKWLGQTDQSTETIYSWEDVNFSKLIGNSIFDLGKTLLPRQQNILLIQQGVGNIKILIPEGTAVSIDASILVGKVVLDTIENNLLNETFKWHSANYYTQERKVKIVVNLLVGNLEVIFL